MYWSCRPTASVLRSRALRRLLPENSASGSLVVDASRTHAHAGPTGDADVHAGRQVPDVAPEPQVDLVAEALPAVGRRRTEPWRHTCPLPHLETRIEKIRRCSARSYSPGSRPCRCASRPSSASARHAAMLSIDLRGDGEGEAALLGSSNWLKTFVSTPMLVSAIDGVTPSGPRCRRARSIGSSSVCARRRQTPRPGTDRSCRPPQHAGAGYQPPPPPGSPDDEPYLDPLASTA